MDLDSPVFTQLFMRR